MLIPGIIWFQTLLVVFVSVILLWSYNKWRNAVERKEEIRRLVDMVSKESAKVEFEAHCEYSSLTRAHQCAVCFRPTTTRCSQCKAVHYCSGKCQIIHWRQGHKNECQILANAMHLKEGSDFCDRSSEKQSEMHVMGSEPIANISTGKELGYSGAGRPDRTSENIAPNMLASRASLEEKQETSKSTKPVTGVNGVSRETKLKKTKNSCSSELVACHSHLPNGKFISGDVVQGRLSHKKSIRRAASSELLVTDGLKCRNTTSSNSSRLDSVTVDKEDDSSLLKGKEARSLSFNASADHPRDASSDFKNSIWRKVQQLRPKQSQSYETLFPYDLFVKLYFCDEELRPFGLRNCGNSCYANTVLQCLAFTRPLTSYFVRGLHSNACQKREWCFICEFEFLILKAREGQSSVSPIRILSKIQNIGSHLGNWREEDAHEFLRYAIDTMQSVCLMEAVALGPFEEETTLVGLTFGGYLRSKITCMKCHGKSEIFERIMDLTVEIDGNIETLEDALAQFTADETLDGENKYNCSRCKSYVKAKKKLTILEAPNILTIVLKRFQSRNFGKLNKSVRFPEVLDMVPYICGRSDKSPLYSLYAVVVHRDAMSDASMGHYVCYIKTSHGEWFGINDSIVMPVELERVLLEEAYMLLYARKSPRAPAIPKSNVEADGAKSKRRNLEAVPSSYNALKARSKSNSSSTDPSKAEPKNGKYPYLMNSDDFSAKKLHDIDGWRHNFVDSSSESSSIFSWSDASSCSTASTNESLKSEDFSDILFGEAGPSCYGHSGLLADATSPSLYRNVDAHSNNRKDTWR